MQKKQHFFRREKTHMHNPCDTLIPGHSQLDMGGIASVDATFQQAQVEGALPDLGSQKKIPGNCHSDGSNPALD